MHAYSIALHDMSSITIINYNNCDKKVLVASANVLSTIVLFVR